MQPGIDTDPTNLFELEALAYARLSRMAYDYYAGGANDGITLHNNHTAFERIALRPRMLRGVAARSLGTEVLGAGMPFPVLIAPMGFMQLAHPDGELALVHAANQTGTPVILSTMSTYSLEAVAAVARVPLWFQLYVYKDRVITQRLVERAETAGFTALVVTVDTPLLGRREADIRNRFALPDGIIARNFVTEGMERIVGVDEATSALAPYIASLWDSGLTWELLAWLRSVTSLPIVVKGVLRGDDAALAVEHGAAGIIVSNHGGRQLDTALAAVDALPEVVAAVGGRAAVLLDGGIRRGTDVLKALALGAQAVLLGRPALWGLAWNGQAGVARALSLLREEFDLAMALCGCRSIAEITHDLIAPSR